MLSQKLSCWYIPEEEYVSWFHWTGLPWDRLGLCNRPVFEGCNAREILSQPPLPIYRCAGRHQGQALLLTVTTLHFSLLILQHVPSAVSIVLAFLPLHPPLTLISACFQIIKEPELVTAAWILYSPPRTTSLRDRTAAVLPAEGNAFRMLHGTTLQLFNESYLNSVFLVFDIDEVLKFSRPSLCLLMHNSHTNTFNSFFPLSEHNTAAIVTKPIVACSADYWHWTGFSFVPVCFL